MAIGQRWKPRPTAGRLVALAAASIPVLASIAAVLAMNRLLPPPAGPGDRILWWVLIVLAGVAPIPPCIYVARRLLPLSMLLRLGLVFPDKAPSRFEVAKRAHRTKDLQRELAQQVEGTVDERMDAAATVLALVAAVEDHDRGTRGHSERVRVLTDLIADEMKLPEDDKEKLRWAALLHDVGKISVPGDILNKAGRPDDDEWEVLRRHPFFGSRIIGPLRSWLGGWISAVEQHHERYDGSGYPRGLKGKRIALGGRIVAVSDSYEVMTAARPYKKPLSVEAARRELVTGAGSQFDPAVVRSFLGISVGRLRWVIGIGALLAQIPVLSQLSYRGAFRRVGRGATAVASAASVVAALTGVGLIELTGLRPFGEGPSSTSPAIVAPSPPGRTAQPEPRVDGGGPGGSPIADQDPEGGAPVGDAPVDDPPSPDGGDPPHDGGQPEPRPPSEAPPEDGDDANYLARARIEVNSPVGTMAGTVTVTDDPTVEIDRSVSDNSLS